MTDEAEQALFLDKDGRALSKRAISALGKKLLRPANLGKAGAAHLFRHSAATAMLEGGADVRFVQELLGHSSLVSTQVYTRVAISKLREVHAATHPGAKLARHPAGAKISRPARGPREGPRGRRLRTLPGIARMDGAMRAMKAHVRGGRLVLDEPTDRPDGDEVELVPLDEVLAGGGDYLDDEERERLHASIDRGLEDVRAGRTVPGEQVIAKLRARSRGR